MRIIVIFIFSLFAFQSASAQHAYIESNTLIIAKSGQSVLFDTPDIFADARYNTLEGRWDVTIKLAVAGSTTDFIAAYDIEFTQAHVDSYSGAGSTETQVIQNCILQAIADYLLDINPFATFTIH